HRAAAGAAEPAAEADHRGGGPLDSAGAAARSECRADRVPATGGGAAEPTGRSVEPAPQQQLARAAGVDRRVGGDGPDAWRYISAVIVISDSARIFDYPSTGTHAARGRYFRCCVDRRQIR